MKNKKTVAMKIPKNLDLEFTQVDHVLFICINSFHYNRKLFGIDIDKYSTKENKNKLLHDTLKKIDEHTEQGTRNITFNDLSHWEDILRDDILQQDDLSVRESVIFTELNELFEEGLTVSEIEEKLTGSKEEKIFNLEIFNKKPKKPQLEQEEEDIELDV